MVLLSKSVCKKNNYEKKKIIKLKSVPIAVLEVLARLQKGCQTHTLRVELGQEITEGSEKHIDRLERQANSWMV